MVKPVQYRVGHDRSARAQGMPVRVAAAPAHPLADRVGLTLTPYGPSSVVIGAPHLQQASQMAFTQRDCPVKTLAP